MKIEIDITEDEFEYMNIVTKNEFIKSLNSSVRAWIDYETKKGYIASVTDKKTTADMLTAIKAKG